MSRSRPTRRTANDSLSGGDIRARNNVSHASQYPSFTAGSTNFSVDFWFGSSGNEMVCLPFDIPAATHASFIFRSLSWNMSYFYEPVCIYTFGRHMLLRRCSFTGTSRESWPCGVFLINCRTNKPSPIRCLLVTGFVYGLRLPHPIGGQ